MFSLWLCLQWLRTPPFHILVVLNVGFFNYFLKWISKNLSAPHRHVKLQCPLASWYCACILFWLAQRRKKYGAVTGTDEEGNDLLSANQVPEKKVCVDPAFLFLQTFRQSPDVSAIFFIPFSETKGTRGKVLRLWNYMAKMRPKILSYRKIKLKLMELFTSASAVK